MRILFSSFLYRNPAEIKSLFQIFFYRDLCPVRRKNLIDQVRPFDQAYTVSIYIVFKTNLVHLFNVTNPIHIKMIERKSSVIIYLDYCKGWTADRFFNPQSFCQSLGKYGLSDAEISYQYGPDSVLEEVAERWRPFRSWAAVHLRALREQRTREMS